MIWKGKTANSGARVSNDETCDRIIQQHREDSHFQNETTFKEWFVRFAKEAVTRRGDRTTPICLILDAASQHKFDGIDELCAESGIAIVGVPPGLTHAFQPADQFVISTLKALVHTGWNKYVEALFAQHDVEGAVGIMYSSCATVVKKQKYRLFAEALDVISRDVVYASWEMSGIMKYAFGAPNPRQLPIIDQMIEKAQMANEITLIETDGDEDQEADQEENKVLDKFAANLVPQAVEAPTQPRAPPPPAQVARKGPGRPPEKKNTQQKVAVGPLDVLFRKRAREETQQL